MKKQIAIGIIILSLIVSCVACHRSDTLGNGSEIKTVLPTINETEIIQVIEQSSMPDGGYRFANAEYETQFSVYATYYIRKAKESAGLSQVPITMENKDKIIERFLNVDKLDLTDIFCAISLLEDNDELSSETKKNISSYFNTLYNDDLNCYVIHNSNASNVYANYLVYTIAKLLNIEINPIINWLEKTIEDTFGGENITEEKSSTYVMLLELAESCHLEIPQHCVTSIIEMFEKSLDDLQAVERKKGIYIPVYLMDYLDFSRLLNIDSSAYWKKIIQYLCDESGVKENTFTQYDVFGLYATTHTLELAQYDFKNYIDFNNVFNEFDAFMLNDDLYLAPGYAESNFLDTYYVDALIHTLDINSSNNISEYCKVNKSQILESGVLNIYYYLELLQRNNLLEIIKDERKDIITKFLSTINDLTKDTENINYNISAINASINGLNILGESWEISDEYFNTAINKFVESESIQQEVYDLSKFVEFICLTSPTKEEILEKYCRQLEDALIRLSTSNVSYKIMLQSMALNAFKKSNYVVKQDIKEAIKNTLNQAQDKNGLFKGGDSNEDVVSFRNIYDAVVLYEEIN